MAFAMQQDTDSALRGNEGGAGPASPYRPQGGGGVQQPETARGLRPRPLPRRVQRVGLIERGIRGAPGKPFATSTSSYGAHGHKTAATTTCL